MKPITQKVEFKHHNDVDRVRADILKALDEICTKNNLQYFCFSRLLVGAVHYNDFIPNGLKSPSEIGLMRDQYNKLVEILYKEAKNYELDIVDRYPSGAKALQFTVTKPVVIEQADLTVSDIASVVISAFDYVPDSEAERKMYFRKVEKLREKYKKMVDLTPPGTTVPMSLRKVFALFWGTLRYGSKNPKKTYRKLLKTVSKYQNTNYITRLVPNRSVLVEYDKIFPTQRIRVNHAESNAPKTFNS